MTFEYRTRQTVESEDQHILAAEMILSKPLISLVFFSLAFVLLVYTSSYSRILKEIELDTYVYPSKLHPEFVTPALALIDTESIENDLKGFVHDLPGDRYYKSENGRKAALYVKDYLRGLISGSAHPERFVVEQFEHEWKQPSILFQIKRDTSTSSQSDKKVIIGCHIDSINFKFYQDAPGVDDNLSGIVTVVQSIRQIVRLVESGQLAMRNSLEFHFYSAEEIGSLGSIQVFEAYRRRNNEVVALLQQDMTGYTQKSLDSGHKEHFGIITDYTSQSLMQFTKKIIDLYCDIPYLDTQCGKICSDHISALMYGYPAIYVLESKVDLSNPFIHSAQDTIERIDYAHMLQHTKLTTAFALELAISDEITRRGSPPNDTASFKLIDYMILLMMHHTKRFVYAVLAFSCAVGSLYVLLTASDGSSSEDSKEDDGIATGDSSGVNDRRVPSSSPQRPKISRKQQ